MSNLARKLKLTDDWGTTAFGFVVLVIAVVLLVTSVTVSGVYYASRHSCTKQAAIYNVPSQYTLWTGCNYQTADGRWVPRDSIRAVQQIEIPSR